MIQKQVARLPRFDITDSVLDLYKETGNFDQDLDERDLIIFRIMGLNFRYDEVKFVTACAPTESDAS